MSRDLRPQAIKLQSDTDVFNFIPTPMESLLFNLLLNLGKAVHTHIYVCARNRTATLRTASRDSAHSTQTTLLTNYPNNAIDQQTTLCLHDSIDYFQNKDNIPY